MKSYIFILLTQPLTSTWPSWGVRILQDSIGSSFLWQKPIFSCKVVVLLDKIVAITGVCCISLNKAQNDSKISSQPSSNNRKYFSYETRLCATLCVKVGLFFCGPGYSSPVPNVFVFDHRYIAQINTHWLADPYSMFREGLYARAHTPPILYPIHTRAQRWRGSRGKIASYIYAQTVISCSEFPPLCNTLLLLSPEPGIACASGTE